MAKAAPHGRTATYRSLPTILVPPPRTHLTPATLTNGHGNAWGGTVGAGIERALTPAWSVGLEYDYYRFATAHVDSEYH